MSEFLHHRLSPRPRGRDGKLFLSSVNLMGEIRPMVAPRPFGHINENVVMPADVQKVSERLDVQPNFVCASDFGWITRPRGCQSGGNTSPPTPTPDTPCSGRNIPDGIDFASTPHARRWATWTWTTSPSTRPSRRGDSRCPARRLRPPMRTAAPRPSNREVKRRRTPTRGSWRILGSSRRGITTARP